MVGGRFSATVSGWVGKAKAAHEAVFKESAQRVVEVMQTPAAKGGNMPIRTGFLRASAFATLDDNLPATVEIPDRERSYSFDEGQISLVINEAEIDDVITVVYTANYARYANYRARFVDLAAQQWPRIVEEVCAEVKARIV